MSDIDNAMTKHHKLPRCRGGKAYNNIIKLPQRFHKAWHTLFGNLTPEESLDFIQKVFSGSKKSWKPEELYLLQMEIQSSNMLDK